ncbi:hypothetical protein NXY11_06380 [Parabacteroides faecis]|nr:hypothetical protein [Parabacteroides faecis]UVQ49458.1 hypothetical protein NXY11_06380 [Parabacteroides faecis]
MEFVIESVLTVHDDILQKELSFNADDKMKNIAAAIQREQNRIIRNKEACTLLIDEMQDYSPIQYKVILKHFPCRKTVLCDASQLRNYHSEIDRRMLYVAITRTIHQLSLTYSGTKYSSYLPLLQIKFKLWK